MRRRRSTFCAPRRSAGTASCTTSPSRSSTGGPNSEPYAGGGSPTGRIAAVSVVKINVLQVPEGRGEMLEQRFASRAAEVDKVDGFESFDLLRPTGGTDRYLVVTK